MTWDYSFTDKALKELKKIGHEPKGKIIKFLKDRIQDGSNPRQFGKALKGDLGEYWRYRVEDYRILCEIKDEELIVLVVKVGNRRDIYD